MKTLMTAVFTALATLLVPYFALSQQAEQPKYVQGDWWKVKSEFEAKVSSRSPGCQDSYKEWVVKIDGQGLAHLYGMDGGKEVEAICDPVLGWVFGVNETKSLKFPLSVGQTWTGRYERASGRRTIWVEPEYKVTGFQKVETPKGTFDAFKIVGAAKWVTGRGDHRFIDWTEYYSPPVKAIVLLQSETPSTKRKVVLVDFNVSN